MAQQGRRVWVQVWKNLINSLIPSKRKGAQVGQDHFGTKYFETAADPQRGKRRPSRWFETKVPNTFDQEMPAEWEAWLRGRRSEPPSVEEINRNIAITKRTILKAKELEDKENAKKGIQTEQTEVSNPDEKPKFPTYTEYESLPGTPADKSKR